MNAVAEFGPPDTRAVIDQFRSAMREHDIDIDGEILADGELHVAHAVGDKGAKRRAWYVLHLDGRPAGAFGHYAKMGGSEGVKWKFSGERRPLTAEERRQYREAIERRRAAREAEQRRQHEEVAGRATAIWEAAAEAQQHPYLDRKGVRAHGLRAVPVWERDVVDEATGEVVRTLRARNALLVPMRDLAKRVWSLQAIFPSPKNSFRRDKDFLPGGRKRGLFHTLGKPRDNTIVFAEGYATAASVHEATRHAVVVCFDAGNLLAVLQAFRERFPEHAFIVAADDDRWTGRPDAAIDNPGLHYAIEAARQYGARVAKPSFQSLDDNPTDFNDLHRRDGAEAVAAQIAAAVEPDQVAVDLARDDEPADEEPPPADGDEVDGIEPGYFSILGYDHDRYYVFQHERKQISVFTQGTLTETGLITLAPVQWWELNFPTEKGGFNRKAAINWFIRTAHGRGIYDPTRLRGRGAWVDDGRAVFHFGSLLQVDGVPTDVTELRSRYTYELERPLPHAEVPALTVDEGRRLIDIARMFRWTKDASAALVAGWAALAPLCGALRWRPHIWITGGAGCGKSTIANEFVHVLMNGMDVFAQGNSTEAGIRQTLRSDALPVVLEESESNEERDRHRIQGILALIRQASTESSARTLKGTAGGDAMHFHIRSMFCLVSIQVGMRYQADFERLTVLALRPKRDDGSDGEKQRNAAEWERLKEVLYRLGRDESRPARLFRRSLELLPTTLKNINTFAAAAGLKFGSQRDGDQYGTMMAGAWSLVSDREATLEEARAWLDQYDWSEYLENADTEESVKALGALLESQVRITGGVVVNVFELVKRAAGCIVTGLTVDVADADATLQRHGMKVRDDRLLLSNNSHELRRLVSGTPYEADLRGQLLRVRGADRYGNRTSKFNGIDSKCISLPLHDLISDDEEFIGGDGGYNDDPQPDIPF